VNQVNGYSPTRQTSGYEFYGEQDEYIANSTKDDLHDSSREELPNWKDLDSNREELPNWNDQGSSIGHASNNNRKTDEDFDFDKFTLEEPAKQASHEKPKNVQEEDEWQDF
jgi:hypothetical protein